MKLRISALLVAVLSASAPSFAEEPIVEARRLWVEEWLARDSDGDGQLRRDDVKGATAAIGFAAIDENGDDLVDASELRQFARTTLFVEHSWVNPIAEGRQLPPGVKHATFLSPSMQREVGYVIYLPPGYTDSASASRRYPVVYYLHGGRPGIETRSIGLTRHVHAAMTRGEVPPAIYVYVNGGKVSHYNWPDGDSMGEDVFVHELIPHVDATYRTIAERRGRAIEGFSQGGRGTARIMFKHHQLFISAASGGAAFSMEKQIFENDGVEFDTRRANPERYEFGKGNDAYTLAKAYAADPDPPLAIALWVGTKGFNYESVLEYMGFLYALEIPHQRFVVPEVEHSSSQLYERIGVDLMNFHASNFD